MAIYAGIFLKDTLKQAHPPSQLQFAVVSLSSLMILQNHSLEGLTDLPLQHALLPPHAGSRTNTLRHGQNSLPSYSSTIISMFIQQPGIYKLKPDKNSANK